MNTITRRIAATAALLAAPALIALGTAGASHADATTAGHGPTTTHSGQAAHPAFPHQTNAPQPGTQEHHRHQRAR